MPCFDFVIVGSGMAGAGAAYELAGRASVLVLERESAHGFHTTGRSAALFIENYGNALIRGLTRASRAFFEAPPEGFCAYPLLTPRGCLTIARADQTEALATALAESGDATALSREAVLALVPSLRPEYIHGGMLEPAAMDADVEALHQGFLRGAKQRGAEIRLDHGVTAIAPSGDGFAVTCADGSVFEGRRSSTPPAPGPTRWPPWAGVAPIGLQPLRRTAVIIDPPPGVDVRVWPAVIDVDEQFYFKPDAGRLLASPADETPSDPCDAWADDMDVAICIDRVQAAADIPVQRIVRSWAGLRSFVADRSPVIGFDDQVPNFFWLAGQGGYGVQTGPAAARTAAAWRWASHCPPISPPKASASRAFRHDDCAEARAAPRPAAAQSC